MTIMRRRPLIERTASVALALSGLALVVVLSTVWWSNRSRLMGGTNWASIPAILGDTPVPQFLLETLDGDTLGLPRIGQRNLLIVYSTTCRFCDISVNTWRQVVSRTCGDAQVIMASREPVDVQRDYWSRQRPPLSGRECPSPLIGRILDPVSFGRGYAVRGTPTHFVIDERGLAMKMWRGAAARPAASDSIVDALRATR